MAKAYLTRLRAAVAGLLMFTVAGSLGFYFGYQLGYADCLDVFADITAEHERRITVLEGKR